MRNISIELKLKVQHYISKGNSIEEAAIKFGISIITVNDILKSIAIPNKILSPGVISRITGIYAKVIINGNDKQKVIKPVSRLSMVKRIFLTGQKFTISEINELVMKDSNIDGYRRRYELSCTSSCVCQLVKSGHVVKLFERSSAGNNLYKINED